MASGAGVRAHCGYEVLDRKADGLRNNNRRADRVCEYRLGAGGAVGQRAIGVRGRVLSD